MTNPLFVQDVLGLTLALCIVFTADSFPWLHVERFQSNSVLFNSVQFGQFCFRLRVIGRSVGVFSSDVVDTVVIYGNKIKAQNIFV